MSSGTCMICNKPSLTLYTCSLCGKTVCEKHYDLSHQTCLACKGGRVVR